MDGFVITFFKFLENLVFDCFPLISIHFIVVISVNKYTYLMISIQRQGNVCTNKANQEPNFYKCYCISEKLMPSKYMCTYIFFRNVHMYMYMCISISIHISVSCSEYFEN